MLPAPALAPMTVMEVGLPLKRWMWECAHFRARRWSWRPALGIVLLDRVKVGPARKPKRPRR